MTHPLELIVDTNLFHEFRRLEELPWHELGDFDPITLIVTSPVQTELDRQKKDSRRRIRKRALEATNRFRRILKESTESVVLSCEARTVRLRLDATVPGRENHPSLDLSEPDDQIVAIAHQISMDHPDIEIMVFSDDTRPVFKARALGLKGEFVPEGWRRTPEQDDVEKENRELREENRKLRAAEPMIEIEFQGRTSDHPLNVDFNFHAPLELEEIEKIVEDLKSRYPQETDFDREKSRKPDQLAIGALISAVERASLTQYKFVPASQEEIEKYVKVEYPNWVRLCQEILEKANELFDARMPPFQATFSLRNVGTRPAADLKISFVAKGSFAIMASSDGPVLTEPSRLLPTPPKAPQGRWQKVEGIFEQLSRSGQMFDSGFSQAHLIGNPRDDLTKLLRPNARNPNAFYFSDQPTAPTTTSFSLTCDQFRHGSADKSFGVLICPVETYTYDKPVTGCLEVIVEAANLSSPVVLRVPLRFIRNDLDTLAKVETEVCSLR